MIQWVKGNDIGRKMGWDLEGSGGWDFSIEYVFSGLSDVRGKI